MTNTTPNPTDALPLPQVVLDAEAGRSHLPKGWIERAIRAAHREGYELAMSKIGDLLSNMDRGVLRMPIDLALGGEIAQAQFYDRVQSLLDRIDVIAAPAQEQPKKEQMTYNELHAAKTAFDADVADSEQHQAGAAEVSDEQLWASDAVMAINAELGLPMEKLARLARAILALKAGGVAPSADVITDAQIAAGAAVKDSMGHPIGRNIAIDVFEAMCGAAGGAA